MRLSRTLVARYLAGHLDHDRSAAITGTAAWLIATERTGQTAYIAGDVAAALEKTGYVYARVVSARPLTNASRIQIETFIRTQTAASEVELEAIIDRAVIGGVRIELPGYQLDATLQRRLSELAQETSTDD